MNCHGVSCKMATGIFTVLLAMAAISAVDSRAVFPQNEESLPLPEVEEVGVVLRAARQSGRDPGGEGDGGVPVSNPRGSVANPHFGMEVSCFSESANDTIPAAHIKGHGQAFTEASPESSEILVGYQQKWLCSEYENQNLRSRSAHAFVDGGMWFNQTDKSLYVPECGYYYISSQILFSVPPPLTKSKTVFHLLKFERNCSSWQPSTAISVIGHSSLGPYDDIFQSGVTTTFTSDVVKLCRGGRVWVEIPDGPNGAPCCPRGDEHGTFISAVLIRHTTCHWPPRMTMDNLNHDDGV